MTFAEKFNSLVRGGALSAMTAVFCYKFLDNTVSTDAFISIYAGVLGWWFATRGNQPQPQPQAVNGAAAPVAEAKP